MLLVFVCYNIGLFLGIQIGKERYQNRIYNTLNSDDKVKLNTNYREYGDYRDYRNYQMDYRFNK